MYHFGRPPKFRPSEIHGASDWWVLGRIETKLKSVLFLTPSERHTLLRTAPSALILSVHNQWSFWNRKLSTTLMSSIPHLCSILGSQLLLSNYIVDRQCRNQTWRMVSLQSHVGDDFAKNPVTWNGEEVEDVYPDLQFEILLPPRVTQRVCSLSTTCQPGWPRSLCTVARALTYCTLT